MKKKISWTKRLRSVFSMLTMFLLLFHLSGGTCGAAEWLGTASDNWNDTNKWSGGLPSSSINATVNGGRTLTLKVIGSANQLTTQNLLVGQNGDGNVYIEEGFTVTSVENMTTGRGSGSAVTGETFVNGGTIIAKENIVVGYSSGTAVATGTITQNSGAVNISANLYLGGYNATTHLGNGTYNMKGGTLSATSISLGVGAQATGTFNLEGGNVTVFSNFGFPLNAGYSSYEELKECAFNMSGGTLKVDGNLYLNRVKTVISGGTITVKNELRLAGTGEYTDVPYADITLVGGDVNFTANRLAINTNKQDKITFSATSTGISTLVGDPNKTATSSVISGIFTADIGGGIAVMDSKTYTLLDIGKVNSSSDFTPVLQSTDIWNLAATYTEQTDYYEDYKLTATLKGTSKASLVIQDEQVTTLDFSDDPLESGWLEVTNEGSRLVETLSFDLTGTGDMDELVEWMLADSAGQLNVSRVGDFSILVSGLSLAPGTTSYLAWDLRGSELDFALSGVTGSLLPEPGSLWLLLLGLAFFLNKARTKC
ncbi:MAG: PEP-CTERM sorting domain-containing protein [Planctomycetia bacterium]|nr:PEP-CTERM sorting domain-containing protein [Planctomycetia bacterium]